MKVNVGLERQLPRRPGAKRRWENKNLQGVEFEGDWDSDMAHIAFRNRVHLENPGWRVQGYAIAKQ